MGFCYDARLSLNRVYTMFLRHERKAADVGRLCRNFTTFISMLLRIPELFFSRAVEIHVSSCREFYCNKRKEKKRNEFSFENNWHKDRLTLKNFF